MALTPQIIRLLHEYEEEKASFLRMAERFNAASTSLSKICTILYEETAKEGLTIDEAESIFKQIEHEDIHLDTPNI